MKLALGHFIQFPSPTPLHVLNNLNNIRMMLFMGFGFTSVYIALLYSKLSQSWALNLTLALTLKAI